MEFYKAKYSDKKPGSKSNRRFDKESKKEHRSFRNSKYDSKSERREMFDVTCADCGIDCKIPFEPKFNKPVYCSRCYEKNEPSKSRRSESRDDKHDRYSRDDSERNFKDRSRDRYSRDDSRDRYSREDSRDRYSRDDKHDRYSRNDSDRYSETRSRERYSREERSFDDAPRKLSKSQRKQDKFFSDGSEKFYASIKEKLFEILGGKICSSCGFRDDRALGFAHVYDSEAFDQIRRGGFASSWGKYISDPDLAKDELRVLCLNCNEIRDPPKKTQFDKPKKKSRYFPR